MNFQIILTIFVSIALLRLCIQFWKKNINLFTFFFFLVVWSVVLFFNWNNTFLNKLGSLLGLEHGASLLVYIALFLLFYYVFVSLIKLHKIEQEISKLVKKDAVNEFLKKHNKA